MTNDATAFERLRAAVEAECLRRQLAFSFDKRSGKTTVGAARPGNRRAIRDRYAHKPERFPGMMYSYYSAVAHAVTWGLMESVDTTHAASPFTPDRRPLYSTGRGLVTPLAVAVDGYRTAVNAEWAPMGWEDETLVALGRTFESIVVEIGKTYPEREQGTTA